MFTRSQKTIFLTLSVCNSCLEISSYFICATVISLLALRSCHVNMLALIVHKMWLHFIILISRSILWYICESLMGTLALGNKRFNAKNCVSSLILCRPNWFDSLCRLCNWIWIFRRVSKCHWKFLILGLATHWLFMLIIQLRSCHQVLPYLTLF